MQSIALKRTKQINTTMITGFRQPKLGIPIIHT